MKPTLTRALLALLALTLAAADARATITFTQLDDDVFTVSHRVKGIGSRAKATKMVYTKAASLCIAAGYDYYRVLDQASQAAQEDEAANATVQVRFFREDGDDRLRCGATADPVYVEEARQKLDNRGYRPPVLPSGPATQPLPPKASGGVDLCATTCTLEQVAAMARTGLSDEQILAACSEQG